MFKQMSISVEAVCASLDDAQRAVDAGASRIELVSSISDGGLTPSFATFRQVHEAVPIPVVTMVRARAGGFCYSDSEFSTMAADLEMFAIHGVREVAVGVLLPDGRLDIGRMRILRSLAPNAKFVCHRAFDLAPDPFVALDQLIEIGFSGVLTGGGSKAADPLKLKEYVDHAQGKIEVTAAGGIRSTNAMDIVQTSGVKVVHLGPTLVAFDATSTLAHGVSYGPHLMLDAEEIRRTVLAVGI